MLTMFSIRGNFCKAKISLMVDCDAKQSSLIISYDGRIVRMADNPCQFQEVQTPELAEKWLHRPCGERGNFVEATEYYCRAGIWQPEKAA